MPFSSPYIGSDPYEQHPDVRIQMVYERPETTVSRTTPLNPGQIIGYYNPGLDAVELYIIDVTGYNYIRVS